jgi:hypothetical protein
MSPRTTDPRGSAELLHRYGDPDVLGSVDAGVSRRDDLGAHPARDDQRPLDQGPKHGTNVDPIRRRSPVGSVVRDVDDHDRAVAHLVPTEGCHGAAAVCGVRPQRSATTHDRAPWPMAAIRKRCVSIFIWASMTMHRRLATDRVTKRLGGMNAPRSTAASPRCTRFRTAVAAKGPTGRAPGATGISRQAGRGTRAEHARAPFLRVAARRRIHERQDSASATASTRPPSKGLRPRGRPKALRRSGPVARPFGWRGSRVRRRRNPGGCPDGWHGGTLRAQRRPPRQRQATAAGPPRGRCAVATRVRSSRAAAAAGVARAAGPAIP